uniref:poly(A) polymerase type 3-like n=1 Tax=Solea senegalensis TaxID=28829 RepID=UPI001CD89F4D|nr:poly(A) polymerase type 3-like [Solea senegalensis]
MTSCNPLNSQAQPVPKIPKYYGITPPISEDLPTETDTIQTKELIKCLRSYDIFEEDLEHQHREDVVKRLESLFTEWLKEMCLEMNVPENVMDNVGGKALPFGSFRLGAYAKGADIDVLCVGPGFIKRKDFFTSFYEKLKAQEVKNIRAVEEAFVPVIKFIYDGIEVDMVIAMVVRKSIPGSLNLLDDKILKDMDKYSVRSLNGYRVTEEILLLVPNIQNFQLALIAIKLWAKRRNIYSNMLGFLCGISLAILVARICQLYPNAAVSTVVIKFFKVYSMWDWSIPVCLRVVVDRYYSLPFWDPTLNPSDRCHMMPIITPAYPQQNTTFNVSSSTLAVITEEINLGHAITQEILQKKADWSKLFETPNFFEKYQQYVVLKVTSAEKLHHECVSLVESKIRHLVGLLERNRQISRAHLHTQSFPGPSQENNKEEVSTQWLIGLLISSDAEIDLSLTIPSFIDTIHSLAQNSKANVDGMSISGMFTNRDNLHWAMPGDMRTRVSCPDPKPAEVHLRVPNLLEVQLHPAWMSPRLQVAHPNHPTVELSDLQPSPSKPVTTVKRPIKLHLLSKRKG